jgi:uncharacterized DUF497 family protein
MKITYDPNKNARNIVERDLPFDFVADLDWETAIAREDLRRDYGERRILVLGFIGDRLHATVVTYRGDAVHVISLRKASRKEVRWYDEEHG